MSNIFAIHFFNPHLKQSCPQCDGTGAVAGGDCPTCDGEGSAKIGDVICATDLFPTYEVLDATVASEYNALSDANKDAYKRIISCGFIDLAENTPTRTKLWSMFGEGTTTRANLETLIG